jgi:hypothetical protein
MQWSLALVVVMSSFSLTFFVIPELIAFANKIKFNFIGNEQLTGYNGRPISSLGGIALLIIEKLLFNLEVAFVA